ncbi:MAG: 30S ribosomal protein S7 [bacterium]|nr:30S ribosomal protein S7 [bacterium]MDZ4232145.1 30S ribosomal protein S7 [Candidatus Pacearchaeota archaeon]
MARTQIAKRVIAADPKYGDVIIAKFINYVMYGGKKSTAQRVVYKAFDIMKEKTTKDPVEVFRQAIENVSPVLEVRSRRVGGATYQVPVEVRSSRKFALAVRWILLAARSKKGKPMAEKLAEEILAAFNKEGAAMKKREDVHRMAEANRAFAHFAR